MIYLIGGPPRCGKTTVAKVMSKKLSIPWISCDTLEVISGEYMSQKEWDKTHPYVVLRNAYKTNDAFYEKLSARRIVEALRKEARATFPAIEMMGLCEIKDGNDYIIEGYHIEPQFARTLIKKYGPKNIRAVFLVKHDAQKFAEDVYKSTTPNDWLLAVTENKETFYRVGKMVSLYSGIVEKEARKYRLPVVSMDKDFKKQIQRVLEICQ